MARRYLLFKGILRQDSAMSIGGNQGGGRLVDMPFCRDGKNRLTLRGNSLAGALIATARQLGYSNEQLELITGKSRSAWRVLTTHPSGTITQARQQVCIDPVTGTAQDKSLYDLEVVPCGIRWPFILEIDCHNLTKDEQQTVIGIAVAVLQFWRRGYCWLGRGIARGTGWLTAGNLVYYSLTHADPWPNSRASANYWTYIEKTFAERARKIPCKDLPEPKPKNSPLSYQEISGHLIVGKRENQYGIDALSIGGHADDSLTAHRDTGHFLIPEGINPAAWPEVQEDTDFPLVMTIDKQGNKTPVIPGSTLRGALRHACRRYWRQVKKLSEPELQEREYALFGDPIKTSIEEQNASTLLVRDAHLSGNDWQAVCLHHHAEDEFTAGAYESSKFDRLVLLSGQFAWRMVIEYPKDEQRKKRVEQAYEDLLACLTRGEQGFLPIGGSRWRGAGWPSWRLSVTPEEGA